MSDEVRAVVALGANLGDRQATLTAAVEELRALEGVRVVAVSDVIETVAQTMVGPDPDAPSYLNGVALLETTLTPERLLAELNAIEAAHGRDRGIRWGDRTLDLDIIAFGDLEQDDLDLLLPHPRAHERVFVLEPWIAVDPDAVLPGRGRIVDLLEALRAEEGL